LAQTERDLELILIDDGSTDSSLASRAVALLPEGVSLVAQSNQGVSAACNLGLPAWRWWHST
jgi:glycosyltransferase involved in cell wall biosynthesis